MTAGTCSLLFCYPWLLFPLPCWSIFNCCSSHLNLFPILFSLITYSPLKHPTWLFFISFTSLHLRPISFTIWFILLFPTHRRTFLQLLANEPCAPTWFLFLTALSLPLFSLYFFNPPFFTKSHCFLPFSQYPLTTSMSNFCVTKLQQIGLLVHSVSGYDQLSGS